MKNRHRKNNGGKAKPQISPGKGDDAGKKPPTGHGEKDYDDIVHEADVPEQNVLEKDPDDLVHNRQEKIEGNYEEQDPDDLVHRRGGRKI